MRYLKQLNKHKNNKTKSEMKHKTLTFRFLDMSRGGFARLFLLLLLPCLSVIGVKATDSNGGVKFNPDVRYSQWAINSRLYDFRGNQKAYGFAKWNSETGSLEEYANKANMKLDYVAGLVGKATLEASDYYVDFDWAKPWFKSAQAYATNYSYSAQKQTEMTLDNMNAAKMAFHIINNSKWGEDAAKTTAKNAIDAIITDLKYYNENYVIGGTKSNVKEANAVQKTMLDGWFHKYNYVDQVWCDGMYMGPALLAQIIKHTGKTNNISSNDWEIIAKQFSITWAQLYDNNTGLLYHGFTANPGDDASSSWAGISKDNVYHSASFWGRANAWYFLALVDILEVMPIDNAYYNTFKGYLTSLAAGIKRYQDETTGCWYQVMDKLPASLTGNYLEASCSSIFTAGYLKAIRLGLLDKPTYEPVAKKAYEGLVNQFMVYDNTDNSTIQLVHSCTSAGLGGKDSRKGDDNYYLTGKDAKVVTSSDPTSPYYYTEGKVLGGFIMAATEYERAYQNQENKQILFAKDLAPNYNFTTEEELDATAYGDGTITYQWYKNGSAIAKATSATYTPTESGSYYCIATAATNSRSAGNNTIQTSTTKVTAKSNSNTDNGSTNNGGSENGTTTIFSLSVNSGANASEAKQSELSLAEYATITGGSASVYDGKGSAQNMIVNGSITYTNKSTQYVKITLDKALAKGDVITITTSGNRIYATKDNSSNTTNNIANSPYTVDDNLAGAYVLYLRSGDNGKTISSISITRTAKKYKVSATAKDGGSVSIANASGTTVTSGTEVEANTSLTFTATPSNGYEFVNWTDGTKVVSTDVTYIATVTAAISLTANFKAQTTSPSPLNVSVTDVTINTTDAEEKQPFIRVYGNGKLLKAGQDYTLSYTVSGDNNVLVDEKTGKFSVKKNEQQTEFIKGTSLITVTATPTSSLGSNYIAGTLQFSYSVSEGKIKPVFLESFKGITINLQPGKSKTIAVPLIYNGEDVSSYFTYTYTIDPAISGLTVDGSKLTFTTPSTTRTYTVKVNADAATIGDVNYGDVYDKPAEISFTLNVDSKYQTISVDPDPKNIQMYAGTTHDAPDLTVQIVDTKQTLGDTEYDVTWFSTSPGVAKFNATTGKIEAVSEGTAEIRVVVTGENLESTTASITVEVDDPAMYRVKSTDTNHGNQTRMWNQDKTMSVVLGGWLFPNPVATNGPTSPTQGPSTEGLSAGYYWGPGVSKAKWKLTGFDYYVVGDKNKNARQENGSNALPETTNIYSADFTSYTGTIKDKMFNVPCSGSFLEFNPVTNGKVTVHIFQNGVFDAKTTKKDDGTTIKEYQYRPQRRVFVMDEAGNFVESTAHIESTNGKPTGGIQNIGKYTWDLDSKTLTIEDVISHFKGIPTTFDMTTDGFKNNVYESLLDTNKVPNAAANDRKGSHGWSVLADSPVTYTFNVKAGKTYYLYNFGSKIGFYGFSFDEGETKPTVDEPTFNDNQTNTITATEDGHVAKVTVNRSMTAGIWTTCVLPFSLNRQQVDAIFGPAYSATAKEGTQILYFDRVENGKVYFVRHAYNTIVANKPFLIKPSKDVKSISTAAAEEYPYVTIEATKNTNGKPDDWCTGNDYTWASSYSNDMTVQVGDGFISKSGTFMNFVGESGTLKGFRGYLKHTETQAGAKPTMLQVVNSSNVDGNNGETTGIEDLIIDADGQLMPANGKVYNINGQLVSEDANSFQSLPSGIYIINGKKYIK